MVSTSNNYNVQSSWINIGGKPLYTLTPNGGSNNGDGGDCGINTPNTVTSGVNEWVQLVGATGCGFAVGPNSYNIGGSAGILIPGNPESGLTWIGGGSSPDAAGGVVFQPASASGSGYSAFTGPFLFAFAYPAPSGANTKKNTGFTIEGITFADNAVAATLPASTTVGSTGCSAGSSTIPFTSVPSGWGVGQKFYVYTSSTTLNLEYLTVASISGTTITLANNTVYAHSSGDLVKALDVLINLENTEHTSKFEMHNVNLVGSANASNGGNPYWSFLFDGSGFDDAIYFKFNTNNTARCLWTYNDGFTIIGGNLAGGFSASAQVITLVGVSIGQGPQGVVGQGNGGINFYPINTVTLNQTLTNGNNYTSLTVTALTNPLVAGQILELYTTAGSGNAQVLTVSAAAAIGATSISVNSFTANYSYPNGSNVYCLSGQIDVNNNAYNNTWMELLLYGCYFNQPGGNYSNFSNNVVQTTNNIDVRVMHYGGHLTLNENSALVPIYAQPQVSSSQWKAYWFPPMHLAAHNSSQLVFATSDTISMLRASSLFPIAAGGSISWPAQFQLALSDLKQMVDYPNGSTSATSYTTIATYTLPPSVLGLNGVIKGKVLWFTTCVSGSTPNNLAISLGGTNLIIVGDPSSASQNNWHLLEFEIRCRDSYSSQYCTWTDHILSYGAGLSAQSNGYSAGTDYYQYISVGVNSGSITLNGSSPIALLFKGKCTSASGSVAIYSVQMDLVSSIDAVI